MQIQKSTAKRLRNINRRVNSRFKFVKSSVTIQDIVYAHAFGATVVLHNGCIESKKAPRAATLKGKRK